MPIDPSTPVLLLGGQENTVSVAESLAHHRIPVSVSGDAHCWGRWSKHINTAYPVSEEEDDDVYWQRLLLEPGNPDLAGCAILAMNDSAIEFVLQNHEALCQRYLVEEYIPELRAAMLDKQQTLALAHEVGVPKPSFWEIKKLEDLSWIEPQITFPVMVKPLHSHRFVKIFGQKLFIIESDIKELRRKTEQALDNDVDVMIVEMIPGGDDLLSSFYTYMDESGAHLLQYTKRIWRRFPKNQGGAVLHESEWLPETAAIGRQFFEGIGWLGLGNIEFKRDPRDGLLKIIEVNSRITAAHRLLSATGMPVDLVAYCKLTKQPVPKFDNYKEGLLFWYPVRDFRAFLELKRIKELTLLGWLKSIALHRTVLCLPFLKDPKPFLVLTQRRLVHGIRKLFGEVPLN